MGFRVRRNDIRSNPILFYVEPMERTDAVVIGAGVIGLAVARALAASGRSVVILEREARIGTGISSRSSEVIHAGIPLPARFASPAAVHRGQAPALCVVRGARRAAPPARQTDDRGG